MKKKLIENYSSLLMSNNLYDLKQLEEELSIHFTESFMKLLPPSDDHLEWLMCKLRQRRVNKIKGLSLNTDYLDLKDLYSTLDKRDFVTLLYFLKYVENLTFEKLSFDSVNYRKITFEMSDFLKFITIGFYTKKDVLLFDKEKNKTNYYQLNNLKKFFIKLQNHAFATSFSEENFRKLVGIPQLRIKRCNKTKYLLVTVYLLENLFFYEYPFVLPNLFMSKLNSKILNTKLKKDNFEVNFYVLDIFTTKKREKVFFNKRIFKFIFFNNFTNTN